MNRLTRVGLAIAVLILLVGIAYLYRAEIVLKTASVATDMRTRVGPNREISWSTGPDPSGRAASERPPNVVPILADDLGRNDLTFGGGGVANGTVPTPNIDSIAADGAAFTNGYAANATCAPSRAALLSGRYGTRAGFEFTPTPPGMTRLVPLVRGATSEVLRENVVDEGAESVPFEDMGMPPSEITLAELLAAQGYHTVHIGKWHLGRANGMVWRRTRSCSSPRTTGSGLSWPAGRQLIVPRLEAHVVRRRYPRALLREVAGSHRRRDAARRAGPPLRHVRDGGCRSEGSAPGRSEDRRCRSGLVRAGRSEGRTASRALLAERRVALCARRQLEAQRERSARTHLALRPRGRSHRAARSLGRTPRRARRARGGACRARRRAASTRVAESGLVRCQHRQRPEPARSTGRRSHLLVQPATEKP